MKKENRLILWATAILLVSCIAIWIGRSSTRLPQRSSSVASNQPSLVPAKGPSQNSVAPIAAQNPGVAATHSTTISKRRFVELSILEQEAMGNEIRKLDLASIFRMWIEARHLDGDLMKQASIGSVLAYVMRERAPSAALIEQIQGFIGDSSNSVNERTQLLAKLAQAATKESMDILIQAATTLPDNQMRQTAREQIRSAGAHALWGDGTFHEELAPALERIWRESKDRELLASVAVAMAKVGAPSSVHLLLSAALGLESQNFRENTAQGALSEIINPDAVSYLAGVLAGQPPTSATSILASRTLANMVDATAAKTLLGWLQKADESAAPLARDYVVHTRNPTMLEISEAALNPAVSFRSEKNREAIRAGLAEYRGNRKSIL